MKLKQSKGIRSLLVISACTLFSLGVFHSCEKTASVSSPLKNEVSTPAQNDRVLSVANVYETGDGKTAEVWFFETPLVYEFSENDPNAKHYFTLLEEAKNNHAQVNVRLAENTENRIQAVMVPTPEQLAKYKKEFAASTREAATEVQKPVDGARVSGLRVWCLI